MTFKLGEALGSRLSPTKSMKGVFSSKGLFDGWRHPAVWGGALDGGNQYPICRNQFRLIWSKLNPWVRPCLGPELVCWFFKSWALLFSSFVAFKPIDFPSKMVPCRLSLDFSLFGHGSLSKDWGPIALFHGTLDLECLFKVALRPNNCYHTCMKNILGAWLWTFGARGKYAWAWENVISGFE
jgi:hypothetical protein